jgi:P63C domain
MVRIEHETKLYLLGHEVKKIVDFFHGQVYVLGMTDDSFQLTSEAAKNLSRLGAAKGGEARRDKLSAERRSEIARSAVQARWEKAGKGPLLHATHKGNFKEEFGIDVECYVLNDGNKTAVISQIGMGLALGLSPRGNAFPRFLASKGMAGTIGAQMARKLAEPIKFQWLGTGAQGTNVVIHGFDVSILIDVCKAIIQAEDNGQLNVQQKHVAKQAHVIINASAKAGIKGLVYALAGYDATKQEVIAAFKFYVREEAREYEKEFPDQLYEEWYRLYNLPRPERNKPWKFMHLTLNQVYKPLAKSSGKILDLTRAQRENSQERYKKLHQFLSQIGVKALRTQLGQLLGIARISKSDIEYEGHFHTLFGEQFDLFKDNPRNGQR